MIRDISIRHESKDGKTRVFASTCLATIEADGIWPLSGGDNIRPVWAMFGGSEEELRPFMANLALGRKAQFASARQYSRNREEKMEFLKSAKYRTFWQRELEGAIVTSYLPEFFLLDPGMVDPAGASFILLPSESWIRSQSKGFSDSKIEEIYEHMLRVDADQADAVKDFDRLIPTSHLFSAYLDRRTRCPIVADGRFYMQIMLACLANGLASWPSQRASYHERPFGEHGRFRFEADGLEDVGIARPIAFHATHEEIEKMLAEQVSIYFEEIRS